MKLTVNGQAKEFTQDLSLLDLVEEYNKNPQTLVIELNGEIIKKEQWPDIQLNDNDIIELVSFVGGG